MRINYIHLDRIDSTNVWAKHNHTTLTPPTCVTAEEQTAGRGRFGRSWISPEGNIYATLYLKISLNFSCLNNLGQIMALSCIEFLQRQGIIAQMKWPNDIIVFDKKIGGVLVETMAEEESRLIFIGLGLNVNMEKKHLSTIDQKATSLFDLTAEKWEKQPILDAIMFNFLENFTLLQEKSFSFFKDKCEGFLAYRGEEITCYQNGSIVHGICHSITEDGCLQICTTDNPSMTIINGEVGVRKIF